jgi:segregation and condensation protein B
MLKAIIETLLFASNRPLSVDKLKEITNEPPEEIVQVIETLNQEYEATERTFRIHELAHGFQLYTLPAYASWVSALYKDDHHPKKLTPASLETLAIIAYNQPITKSEIERLRGVDASGPITTLSERGLIRTAGHAHRLGSPLLYVTAQEFLRYFGLASLADLPKRDELQEFLRQADGLLAEGHTDGQTAAAPAD